MRTSIGLFLVLTSIITVTPPAVAQAPTPVVERIETHFGRTTRVSLFSNQVVVVAVRSESEDFVHRATLSFDEYMFYLQALEQAAGEIGNDPVTSDVEARDSSTKLTLHVGPRAPRVLTYSPLASLKMAAARIDSIVDDLENRALSALPGEYEIERWDPVIGECVKLRQGGEACVKAVDDDGTVVLVDEESSVSMIVARENRAEVILEIIEPEP
jgi:hypothetical protein